jgi:diguanylate cyclase (GGDEF)-like protein
MVILCAVFGLGWLVTTNARRQQEFTENLYVHPFAVSNAAGEMKSSLLEISNRMLQMVFVRQGDDDLQKLRFDVEALTWTIRSDLALIKARFLGDRDKITRLETALDQWEVLRESAMDDVGRGDIAAAAAVIRTPGSAKFAEIVPLLDDVAEFTSDRAKRFAAEAEQRARRDVLRTVWMVAMLIALIIGTAVVVIGRVTVLRKELDRQASVDFLTGLPNRRYFMRFAERELDRSRRFGEPFTLAVVDLDMFKSVNDNYGHQAGDQVLKRFADVCRSSLRNVDMVGRIGGEEFAILLPKIAAKDAWEVVERLRQAVVATEIDVGQSSALHITATFGLAGYSAAEESMDSLFRRADDALYEAKRHGRNMVYLPEAS